MNRRKFLTACSTAIPGIIITNSMNKLFNKSLDGSNEITEVFIDDNKIKKLGDQAIALAKSLGCDYSDFRVTKYRNQNISTRENSIENVSDTESFGFSVRVIKNGSWGFAGSSTFNESEVNEITKRAAEIA